MPTPFLTLNPKSGTPQIKRSVTGVVANVSGSVAAGTVEAGISDEMLLQRAIRFLGCNTWIYPQGTSIYRSTDAGASYSTVAGPDADLGAGTDGKTPLSLSYVAGVPTLSFLTEIGGSGYFLWTSTNGTSWTKTGPFPLAGTSGAIWGVSFWRGSFYGFSNTPNTIVWNPGSLTVSSVAVPSSTRLDFVSWVFNDRLFGLWDEFTGAFEPVLYEFVGGSWVVRDSTIPARASGTLTTQSKNALFVDPTANVMVAIIPEGGAAGYRVYQWDSTLTRTEITSAVGINAALGASTGSTRLGVILDTQAAVPTGGTPPVSIYSASSGVTGTAWTLCEWNGVASPMLSIGGGGDVAFAMPFGVQNGGSVFWTNGQRHIERVSATPASGGVTYGFRIYSPNPSVDAVSVRWIYGVNTDEFPHSPFGTLTNPSAGVISGGNTITGLDAADNGATLFTVTWLAETDGFSVGDFAKTTPEIFS